MSSIEDRLEKKAAGIDLIVYQKNPAARALYESLGYKAYTTRMIKDTK